MGRSALGVASSARAKLSLKRCSSHSMPEGPDGIGVIQGSDCTMPKAFRSDATMAVAPVSSTKMHAAILAASRRPVRVGSDRIGIAAPPFARPPLCFFCRAWRLMTFASAGASTMLIAGAVALSLARKSAGMGGAAST